MERVASNVTVDQIKEMDMNGLIKRNLIDAPIKDTVAVPDGGYTIVRFVATNPGNSLIFIAIALNWMIICFCFRLLVIPLPSVISHRSRDGTDF